MQCKQRDKHSNMYISIYRCYDLLLPRHLERTLNCCDSYFFEKINSTLLIHKRIVSTSLLLSNNVNNRVTNNSLNVYSCVEPVMTLQKYFIYVSDHNLT